MEEETDLLRVVPGGRLGHVISATTEATAPTMTSPSPRSQEPTTVRWLVFTLACAASFILYLHRYSWGVIKPALKHDYPDLTDTQLGWLDSAFNATYAVGQVPTGLAGDLFGRGSCCL